MNSYSVEPIGVVRTPFESLEGMPIQPTGTEATGTVELDEEYTEGLRDLDGFSHCILVYYLHHADDDVPMTVEPFLDDTERGLFATRAPNRPNPIGVSVVEVLEVDGPEVEVGGIDTLDGTPVLDIKPFVPEFDAPEEATTGWLESVADGARKARSDDRFL
jgi:tRNA-Thr(GGU) m(6)t(6)A37 methyltransferase TsaA